MAKTQSNIPGWVWLFTGVVTGLFLAFLYYLAGIKPSDQQVKEIQVKTPSLPTDKITPKFDFYTLLPDREVVAPMLDCVLAKRASYIFSGAVTPRMPRPLAMTFFTATAMAIRAWRVLSSSTSTLLPLYQVLKSWARSRRA